MPTLGLQLWLPCPELNTTLRIAHEHKQYSRTARFPPSVPYCSLLFNCITNGCGEDPPCLWKTSYASCRILVSFFLFMSNNACQLRNNGGKSHIFKKQNDRGKRSTQKRERKRIVKIRQGQKPIVGKAMLPRQESKRPGSKTQSHLLRL